MKPLHLAVAAAVLAVAALVAYLAMSSSDRADTRRATGREEGTAAAGAGGSEAAAKRPNEANAGTGALAITLKIVGADETAAGGADVELDGGLATFRAAADADGILRVRGLAVGLYDLRARHGKESGALHFELRRTTDLGTLRLAATLAVRGHVHGPQGEPLARARVEACRAIERSGFNVIGAIRSMAEPEDVVSRTTTGEDGAYELVLPGEGTYALRAVAEGFAQEGEPAAHYAADVDGIDFWLMPGALLKGHVLDADQAPVAGARVMVADPMALFGRRTPKAETTAGADGAFSMVVQPSQQMMLIVRAAGYASYMQPNLQLPQPNLVVTLERGVTLTLQAVDEERPEVPAPHASVIAAYKGGFGAGETDDTGHLVLENLPTHASGMGGNQHQVILWGGDYVPQTFEIAKDPVDGVIDMGVVKVKRGGTVRGRVLDKATGEGIAGARVRTFGGLTPELMIFASVNVVSAGDGSFTLTGVPLGANVLYATHADYVSDMDPATLLGGMGGGPGGPPLFAEGSRDVERDVELRPAESITGVVLGPDGAPVAGATVHEVSDERMIFAQFFGSGLLTATTDLNGAFVLKGLRPGAETKITATHRDFGPSEATTARAGDPAAVTLRLTAPLTLQGTVVDDAGGPVAGVRVQATRAAERSMGPRVVTTLDPEGARPTVTDEQGAYVLRNVPTGDLTITFDHPDFAILTKDLSLAASRDLGRTVLARGATISGEVVDADGKPVAGIGIYAWRPSGGNSGTGRRNASATADEQGKFAFRGLADGDYQLRIWDQRYFAPETSVKSGTTGVRIVLRTAAKLLGRVTGRGEPVSGASVRAKQGDNFVGWAQTGADGTFAMNSLPPDEAIEVTVTHDAFRDLTVQGVQTSDRTQDFVMQPGIEVSGVVEDARGNGIEGANVNVQVGGKWAKRVNTDASGHFTAGGLGDGAITLQLDAADLGYIPSGWITVTPGARDVHILATPGETIAGTVRDRDGKPVLGVSVAALDAAGNQVAQTYLWQEGSAFELKGLKPGTYTIRVQRFQQTAEPGQQLPPPHDVPGVTTGTKNLDLRID
jgi:protocatechuate 3,4-dioxygenase beta subunit